jgi:hypothetical protein
MQSLEVVFGDSGLQQTSARTSKTEKIVMANFITTCFGLDAAEQELVCQAEDSE